LLLRDGVAVRLTGSPFSLRFSQRFAYSRRDVPQLLWSVQTIEYIHELSVVRDHRQVELIAFHWHPDPGQRIRYPHAHLGYGAGDLRHGLDKAHIPTGRLTIADAVRFAITELGAEPLREDWDSILQATLSDR
jgi:hypothetical protein